MIKLLITIILFVFGGCTVTKPYVHEYIIAPKLESQMSSSKSCKVKSLKVAKVFSPSTLKSEQMRYIKGEYQEFSFTESKWAVTPNNAFNLELIKALRASKLFANVSSFKSRSRSDLLLEANLEEFMQFFSQDDKESHVRIAVSYNLIDTHTNKTLGTTLIAKELDVKSTNALGGVDALNSALADLLRDTELWLSEECK